ncbi:MAG: hypothetical protein OSA99_19675 [Acidimicrobiales bacterium]|nr:hypothetical protein [Acidimicrobiales bacterium]
MSGGGRGLIDLPLPLRPEDIPHLPGDAALVRASADTIRSTLADIASARVAAVRLAEIGDGVHWEGDAFDAFRRATERKPLVDALDRAAGAMRTAAERLDWFAARFDANAARIRWCRSRLAMLDVGTGDPPAGLLPELEAIAREADDARRDHRTALDAVAATFDHLDDQPTFATPPPSNWERVRGYVADGARGLAAAVVELGTLGFTMTLYTNPVTAPWKLRDLWEEREQVVAVLQFAVDHPGEFATELGKAVIDLESWSEEGVAYWVGKRIPDIALSLATAGVGTVAPAATGAARGALSASRTGRRVVSLADDLAGLEGAFARVSTKMPSRLIEQGLTSVDPVRRATAMTRRATSAFLLDDATAFTGPQRVALSAIIGGRTLARVESMNEVGGRLPR